MLDFAIIGAQKAASSSLHTALMDQPDIYLPPGESPLFEEPEYSRGDWRTFGSTAQEQLVGFKRPDLLGRVDLIERVFQASPNLRIIVVLREPVSRAISAYYHLVRQGLLKPCGLDNALHASLEAADVGTRTPLASLVSYGLYGRALRAWYESFSPENFMIVSHNVIINDLQSATAAAHRHVGGDPLSAVPGPKSIHENSGTYSQVGLRLARQGQLIRTAPLPGSLHRRTPRKSRLARLVGGSLYGLGTALEGRKPSIQDVAEPVRVALTQRFSDDLQDLRHLAPAAAIDWNYCRSTSD